MFHIAEIIREAKNSGNHADTVGSQFEWYALLPLPFLWTVSQKAFGTIKRKAPNIIKHSAVYARDCIVDTTTNAHVSGSH